MSKRHKENTRSDDEYENESTVHTKGHYQQSHFTRDSDKGTPTDGTSHRKKKEGKGSQHQKQREEDNKLNELLKHTQINMQKQEELNS